MKFAKNDARETTSVTVTQLGARMHYAVPRILYYNGLLEHFYTDICATKGWPKYLNLIPSKIRNEPLSRLTGRVPSGIPEGAITTFPNFGLEYASRLRKAYSMSEYTKLFLWANKKFAKLVLDEGLKGSTLYSFNTAAFELLQAAKEQCKRTIVEQTIVPRQVERDLIREEQQLHPQWETPIPDNTFVEEYIEREEREWKLADTILCGSKFVKQKIEERGGPVERCTVVPYGVDNQFTVQPTRLSHDNKQRKVLRVLTVGSVTLRKGVPYILEAAKKLQGKANFRLVGSVRVVPEVAGYLQSHLELIGQVPRSHIHAHYAWADVFLLPSICEGSATVTYEALAAGLPVIATPNTGAIIRDQIEGFIIPIRDVDTIVEKLQLLANWPDLLAEMSESARQRAVYGSFDNYAKRLIQVFK